jgi:aryl-alcohol dehydrogenase-like predicted oxidoreductase
MDSKARFEPRPLGRTGRVVGPLGLAASFGVGETGVLEAFERGVRYFYWGSLRRGSFGRGLREVLKKGREQSTVVIQTYTRIGMLMGPSVRRALRKLDTDHADVLLLGWWNSTPPQRILDAAQRLKDAGTVKHIALSTHERPLVAELATSQYEVFHMRYNAAHRGAEKEIFPHIPEARDSRPGIIAFTATRWGQLCARPKGLDPSVPVPTAGDCYRFCLSDRHVDVALCGARNDQDVKDALDNLDKGPMTPEEIAWMKTVGDAVRARATNLRDR